MTAMGFAAVVLAWVLGALIVAALWPRERSLRGDLSVILPLGTLVGFGVTSFVFFGASLVSMRPAMLGGVIEITAVGALLWGTRRRWRFVGHETVAAPMSWLEWLLAFVFVQAAVVAVIIAVRAYQAEPLGGWDGWAIWNLHARFMLRAGTSWSELLAAPQLSWTHPDYPWLVPASVARVWASAGDEAPLAAGVVSVTFAVATLMLLVAVVARLRGRLVALAGGLLLLGTPFFVTFAPNQHADIPLASFMLAAVVLVVMAGDGPQRNGWWALAGICLGCAAWTKNEGLLFTVVFAIAAGIHAWRQGSRTAMAGFFGALMIALIPVIYFKLRLAPANDLMSAPRLAQLGDPARYGAILSSLGRDLGRFGEWQWVPWIAMALPFAAWSARRRLTGAERLVPVMLVLMVWGYYAVYLISPQDLAWHLDTSLVRLLLQLWPMAIFLWCLAVPIGTSPERTDSRVARWASNRTAFVAASCLAAAGVVGALSLQRAANELAVRRFGFAEMSAALGEGWFALEKHERDEWVWSSGQGKLLLHVSGRSGIGPTTLRFALRGVGARTVTVRAGSRTLWQGAVGEQFVPVTISDLTLPPGTTTIELTTDAPGIAESAAAGGRSLAFALYNLRLR